MKTSVKLLLGAKALVAIRKLNITHMIIDQWYVDKKPSCYILYDEDDKTLAFALMSKMDFDPLKKHSNPKTLNYIFTIEEHRRKGYATMLVNHIKERDQFSAFCSNEISESLLTKCECINFGEMNHSAMFRYP